MSIIVAIASILVITGLTRLINKKLPFKVCPICAGVSGAWFLMTIGMLSGWLSVTGYQLVVAILMGGTVVGIAYQGEKVFQWAEENIFRFRVPAIVLGFILVYVALRNLSWLALVAEGIILFIVTYVYFIAPYKRGRHGSNLKEVRKLEEEMENCC